MSGRMKESWPVDDQEGYKPNEKAIFKRKDLPGTQGKATFTKYRHNLTVQRTSESTLEAKAD